ncbi:MAG: hypothetical protein AAF471_08780 [Myxococcota bacterium]
MGFFKRELCPARPAVSVDAALRAPWMLESPWVDLRAFKQEEQGRECVEAVVHHALLAAPEREKDDILKRVEQELGPEEEEVAMTVASAYRGSRDLYGWPREATATAGAAKSRESE